MTATTTPRTIGTRPVGAATGTQANLRWATVHTDDGTVVITTYRGWGIVDEVRLSGRNATSDTLVDVVVDRLLTAEENR
jgi:hypothetical protein